MYILHNLSKSEANFSKIFLLNNFNILKSLINTLHRKSYSLLFNVNAENLNVNYVANRNDVGGMLYKFIRKL